jgi:hypothetical protein
MFDRKPLGIGQVAQTSEPVLVLLAAVHLEQHPRATLSRKARRKRVSMRPRAQVRDARVIARFGAEALVAPLVESAARPRAAHHFVACVWRKARTLAIVSGMIFIFGCDFKITTRSALLLATRITAHFSRLRTSIMVSSCNKEDWVFFPCRLSLSHCFF